MSATTTDPNAVKAQTEEIVISRADIRPRLAEVVTHNAWRPQQAGGLIGLMQAVIDGALAGLAERVPQEGDDVLCQVVEGLGDGLSQTALAGQMALVEAAKCNRFTTCSPRRLSED